jgi:hypothetical protein
MPRKRLIIDAKMNNTLDILILDSGGPAHAVVYARFGADTAIELIPCKSIAKFQNFSERLKNAAGGRGMRPKADELLTFGHELFSFAVQNKLLTVYNRLPGDYVRIQVLSNQPDLQALPWEYLQFPNAPAGPNINRSIIRIVPTIGQLQPKPRELHKRKLSLLFAFADPTDQGPVAWEDIQATIDREFRSRLKDNFEIDVIEGANVEALTDALQSKPYDIFHFNGHGEILVDENGRETGHLVLVDSRTQQTQRLSAEKFALLVQGRGLQLVVLSACSTSAGNFAKSYAVVAQSLVDCGVPAVVANQFPVTNSIAATFAYGLYRSLLRTGDIDRAVSEGRIVLDLQKTTDNYAQIEWGIPTLYRHVDASQIFTP